MTSPTPVQTPGLESMMGTPTKERKSLESIRSSPAPSEATSQSKSKPPADEEEVNLEVRLVLWFTNGERR